MMHFVGLGMAFADQKYGIDQSHQVERTEDSNSKLETRGEPWRKRLEQRRRETGAERKANDLERAETIRDQTRS
ncbi:hypothetical protein TNCV_2194811 [Trichonephila clavipes]|uniref:Uncharacterized protein n=1 Tax=Trichonephila clavipes TaxID=2585209 RepID=A0A8X6SFW6_TRICX|nr:hypothetical protein TNCV_2194811 [Trichonephila clavipes]